MPKEETNELVADLRATFAAHANPADAAPMQAYMKSSLPFYGLKAPLRRRLQADVVARHPCTSTSALAATMKQLWRAARYREERYAAIEIARDRRHAKLATLALLPLWEEMIRDGAWWDYCDDISASAIGPLLESEPARMKPVLRRWARGKDIWLRRAAFLCQRRHKAVDAELLYDCILPSLDRDEFFLRKGIGWALRERAYAAPAEVIEFCRTYADRLAPLTRREALRVLAARGNAQARRLLRP
ncbi:MAG TPA: DNA alkylation repair protein [Burkholderiaceae bacterium]|nr:DNA alkylation repair protein [Burkholderiaceae bacterium]